jgi:hypothetical protein
VTSPLVTSSQSLLPQPQPAHTSLSRSSAHSAHFNSNRYSNIWD